MKAPMLMLARYRLLTPDERQLSALDFCRPLEPSTECPECGFVLSRLGTTAEAMCLSCTSVFRLGTFCEGSERVQ